MTLLLSFAGIQSIAVLYLNHQLHQRQMTRFGQYLPPLESMERRLFITLKIAFVVFTFLLLTSLYAFGQGMLQPRLLQC